MTATPSYFSLIYLEMGSDEFMIILALDCSRCQESIMSKMQQFWVFNYSPWVICTLLTFRRNFIFQFYNANHSLACRLLTHFRPLKRITFYRLSSIHIKSKITLALHCTVGKKVRSEPDKFWLIWVIKRHEQLRIFSNVAYKVFQVHEEAVGVNRTKQSLAPPFHIL